MQRGESQRAEPRLKSRQKCRGSWEKWLNTRAVALLLFSALQPQYALSERLNTDPALTQVAVLMHDAKNARLIRTERRKVMKVVLLSGKTNREDLRSTSRTHIFQFFYWVFHLDALSVFHPTFKKMSDHIPWSNFISIKHICLNSPIKKCLNVLTIFTPMGPIKMCFLI